MTSKIRKITIDPECIDHAINALTRVIDEYSELQDDMDTVQIVNKLDTEINDCSVLRSALKSYDGTREMLITETEADHLQKYKENAPRLDLGVESDTP